MTVETLPGFDTDDWPTVADLGAGIAQVRPPSAATPRGDAEGSGLPVDATTPASPPAAALVPVGPPRGVLLAVDGNSLVHRAFHGYAQTGMRAPDDRPMWAVYGFLTLLLKIADMNEPDAIVVGFDDSAGSVRRDRYPGYKAGRPDRPDELRSQMADTITVLRELGVPVVIPVGLEADDVLASAAAAAERAGWRCVVATSDKDAFRLISDRTTVMRLKSGLDNAVGMTPELLAEQYGVTPAQWPDYAALVGDRSDNLPGVDGIGPKFGAKLLTARGSLDRALADQGATAIAVGKAAAARLCTAEAKAAIARNRDLMEPVADIPVDVDACRLAADPSTVTGVLNAWRMSSLVVRAMVALCPSTSGDVPPPPLEPSHEPAPRRAPGGVLTCKTSQCGAKIRMVFMESGGRMPVDADPHPDGNLGWAKSDLGWRMIVLGDGEQPADGRRWMTHFKTCANPGEHRKPRPRHLGTVAGPALEETAPPLEDTATAVLEQAGLGPDPAPAPTASSTPPRPGPLVQVRAETRTCCTPGHDGRPARLYPGGVFCDDCVATQRAGRLTEARARR